ncbi:AAA family ATPase [Brachybacterium saurashtrense]|uniref:Pilus assembly protein CpaE n=1 Tax=Brachybacterium saurashtrense TaxID=556288 RepID=A0A345YNK7_9MICO|nr:P-loop NTPase [Brachybacterium saurashtrense]AXK45509.1 pilus assembly protein CpaE [Brachybacterium saurashtrense]RRR21119.1 pilus assembly protein CpaE [Brachybacterium saurashtrense]
MIDIVLCASGSDEVRIVHDLATDRSRPARVVRRCADLAETLAVAAAGIGDAVLIDLTVRGLGRDALASLLREAAVVGLRPEDSPETTSLGLRHMVPAHAPVEEILAAVEAAVHGETEESEAWVQEAAVEETSPRGRLLAVWGPVGAPGRSTIAVNLAAEAAAAGQETVLVDADTYGPALSQVLGVLDEAPGLVAAARSHDRDALDAETLESLLPQVQPGLRLLSGIGVPGRWAELRRTALDGVWGALARRGELVIADVAPVLEEDEELSYDTAAPQRNAATLSTLDAADAVLAVVSADPVSTTRLLREQSRLAELGVEELHVVVNRVGSPVPGERLRELIASRLPVASLTLLPDDPVACRTAAWDGALLAEAAPRSALRRGLRDLAASEAVRGTLGGERAASVEEPVDATR